MNILNRKLKIDNFLFFIGWFIFVTSHTLLKMSEISYLINGSSIYKYLKLVVISIFAFKIFFADKYNLKKIVIYLVLIIISFVNSILIDNATIFFIILVILAASNINFKNLINFDMKLKIFLLILLLFLSFFGILPNYSSEINGNFKQAFGFLHPNMFCFYVITILLEYMYICKKNDFKYIFINFVIVFILYNVCLARTAIYTYIIVFFVNILIIHKDKIFNNKFIKLFLIILPVLITILSVYAVIQYGNHNQLMRDLNKIFTTRISNGYNFYEKYGINLFGNKIETISTREAMLNGSGSKILDMGYLNLLISYGYIVSFVFIYLLCSFQKNLIEKKDYRLLLICTFFIISGFAETSIFNIAINFSIIPFINFSKIGKTKLKEDVFNEKS